MEGSSFGKGSAMPDKKLKVRVTVDLEGDLASAFLKELGKRVARGGTSSKADQGRVLIAEALQARGQKVVIPETNWGGDRTQDEDLGRRLAYRVG